MTPCDAKRRGKLLTREQGPRMWRVTFNGGVYPISPGDRIRNGNFYGYVSDPFRLGDPWYEL